MQLFRGVRGRDLGAGRGLVLERILAVVGVGILPPSPPSRAIRASQPRRNSPTQRAGAELILEKEGGKKKSLFFFLFYFFFPKKVTRVLVVLKLLAVPERARRGFPRRCFPERGNLRRARGKRSAPVCSGRGGGAPLSFPVSPPLGISFCESCACPPTGLGAACG